MLAFAPPQRHNPAFYPYTYNAMHGRQPQPSADMGGDFFRESIRELAQQRARKAQWLPDELDDSDDELDNRPQERKYLEALKMQQNMDRMRNVHEARATAMQDKAERLRRAQAERAQKTGKQMDDQGARQRVIEQVIKEASEVRAAALEREANLRAERMRKQHEFAFTPGHTYSLNRSEETPGTQSSSKVNPIPEASSPKARYTEKHETAASVIQHNFRIHRSLRAVCNIASEFQELKSAFVYPSVIDFQGQGEEGHISVPTTRAPSEFVAAEEVEVDEGETRMEVDGPQPKLAYTAVNYPVHLYVDAMERLLMRLDGVESWGDEGVRERRRSVVREIGRESERLERFWKQAWMDHVERQGEGVRTEEEEHEVQTELEEVDEEMVHVEHPKGEDNDEWLDVAALTPVVPST